MGITAAGGLALINMVLYPSQESRSNVPRWWYAGVVRRDSHRRGLLRKISSSDDFGRKVGLPSQVMEGKFQVENYSGNGLNSKKIGFCV